MQSEKIRTSAMKKYRKNIFIFYSRYLDVIMDRGYNVRGKKILTVFCTMCKNTIMNTGEE